VIGVPAGSSSSPRLASSPGSRQSGGVRDEPSTTTSPSTVESSIRTTPVAPAGTMAPVAISTQVPSSTSGGATPPARIWPTIRHGAPPRTAQPSTLDVANAGRSVSVTSGSARVRPSLSTSGTRTAAASPAAPTA
jgi:hypothetical protein